MPTMLGRVVRGVEAALKSVLYGRRGEPFVINRHTLRYAVGTKPTALSQLASADNIARYDALQMKLLSETLREGDIAIDIGAHAGQYAIAMAAFCGPTGQVIAFEPDPYARQKLRRNIELNPHIKPPLIEELAVSNCSESSTLYSRAGDSTSSLVGAFLPKAEQISVTTISLDDYLATRNIKTPRWVKVDTEGAEIKILQGAKRLLASDAGVICELHPYAWEHFGSVSPESGGEELKAIAAESNRRVRYLDEDHAVRYFRYGAVVLERVH